MIFFIAVPFVLIPCLAVYGWLKYPGSALRTKYWKFIENYLQEANSQNNQSYDYGHVLTEEDLTRLPEPIKKFYIKNGYINGKTKHCRACRFEFKQVPFALRKGDKINEIVIDYTVHTFTHGPVRSAFIDSSMMGLPFQGFDNSHFGLTTMEGYLAKALRVVNAKFDNIDSAYLGEGCMHPSLSLQKAVSFKTIDPFTVEATITNGKGIQTTGTFHFNEKYELVRFVDPQRLCAETGTRESWEALYEDYEVNADGINMPKSLYVMWHFKEGDLVYFKGKNCMNVKFV